MKHLVSFRLPSVALSAILMLASCSGGGSPTSQSSDVRAATPRQTKNAPGMPETAREPETAEADVAASIPPAQWGSIVGRVTLQGTAPPRGVIDVNKDVEVCSKGDTTSRELLIGPDNGVANAVVYLKSVTGGRGLQKPDEHPVVDQRGCRYEPHILLVPAGSTIDFKNSDGILHNLHTYSHINTPFNAAQPKFKKIVSKELDHAEIIHLTCDVHGWMRGWVVVQDHPYYALTGTSGTFHLDGVPPGTYDIEVWHETLGSYTGKVTVKATQPTQHDVSMRLPG